MSRAQSIVSWRGGWDAGAGTSQPMATDAERMSKVSPRPGTLRRERPFVAGGEMGDLMRELDWAATPVGRPGTWPQSLRTAISILLDSRFPMLALWGPELVQFYNDAFRPILGRNKHPAALGQRARACWSEIWDVIGPMFDGVMARDQATFAEDLLFFLDRNGYLEETYFTFCYSAIRDETSAPGGVLVTCVETTAHVIGERRLHALRQLAGRATDAEVADDAAATAALTLGDSPADVPFALVYLFDADRQARLVGSSALHSGSPVAPFMVDLQRNPGLGPVIAGGVGGASSADPWEIASVAATGRATIVHDLEARLGRLPGGRWPESPDQALVLPIRDPGETLPTGALVVGLSPRLPFDDGYRGFLELAADHTATAIANARAREAERRRAEALAELDRAKTAFFSNVSHELRTPLTLVLGPVEQALEEASEPAERERFELIHRNALRLLRLVNMLLDFSRIEAGRVDASFESVDLPAYTAELASTFRSAFDRASLAFEVDCPPLPRGIEAYVDRDMWEKVVFNLLSNAFKFTFEGGVRISVSSPDDARIELRVADSGIGIAPADLPRLFERFHRVKGARGRTQEGSGIGLALVHELVKLHGGTVGVESELGRGSTFTVTLPTGRAHLPVDRIGEPRALTSTALGAEPFVEEALRWLPDGGLESADSWPIATFRPDQVAAAARGARVLVVDDNSDMRDYLTRLLAPQFDVEAVGDAPSAIEAVVRRAPDLVLSDVMLPGRDGLGLLETLRANPTTATVPVVLLSARAGEEAKVEGLRAGADDYLVKPFSARELLARVESHLRLAALRAEVDAERERRYEAERRSREAMERVHRHLVVRDAVGVVLVEASLQDGPPRILDEICRGFGWDWGVFWEVDAEGSALLPIATWASPRLDVGAFEAATRAMSFGRGHGLPGRVWATGQPVRVADARRDRWFARRGAAVATGLRSGIGLPVRSSGHVVAVLELMSQERRRLDADMLATLAAIGAKVGQFVERRRAEEVLRRSEGAERSARVAAEAAVQARDEFVATVSHDLSNPLAAIKGHVQLLRRRTRRGEVPAPAQLDTRLAVMEGAAADMERLIGDLLDAARLQAGRLLDLRRQPADLVALASQCAAAYERLSDRHRLRVSANTPMAQGFWDVARVQRVVANLLANAIKYSPAGGDVVMSVGVDGDSAVLTVRDEGMGIPAADLPHVFERFHRGSNVERISGTGIGLAGAKDIVELHGGTIAVTSVEGRGTTVAVRLPLTTDAGR